MLFRARQWKHSSSGSRRGRLRGSIAISLALAVVLSQSAQGATVEKTAADAKSGLAAEAQSLGSGTKTVTRKSQDKPSPNSKAVLTPKPDSAVRSTAASESSDPASKRYKELNSASAKGSSEAAKRSGQEGKGEKAKKSKTKSPGSMLVPPPPPTIPTYINVPTSGFDLDLGFSVPSMSLDDLKFQIKNVEKKLDAAKLDEKDQKRNTDEKQERAQRFVALFDEGVVSRRELETAKKEAERSVRDLEQIHIKVNELDRVQLQVKERIQALEALKKPVRVSSKKPRRK